MGVVDVEATDKGLTVIESQRAAVARGAEQTQMLDIGVASTGDKLALRGRQGQRLDVALEAQGFQKEVERGGNGLAATATLVHGDEEYERAAGRRNFLATPQNAVNFGKETASGTFQNGKALEAENCD